MNKLFRQKEKRREKAYLAMSSVTLRSPLKRSAGVTAPVSDMSAVAGLKGDDLLSGKPWEFPSTACTPHCRTVSVCEEASVQITGEQNRKIADSMSE